MKKVYPYHDSLKSALGTCESVLVAARLIRALEEMLDISGTSVEILIAISGSKLPLTFKQIRDVVPQITDTRTLNLLRKLKDAQCITFELSAVHEGTVYQITECAAAAIRHVDKSMLS